MKKVQITLELNEKVVKKFQKRLNEDDGQSFKEWLEMEFNQNGDALLEMLLEEGFELWKYQSHSIQPYKAFQ